MWIIQHICKTLREYTDLGVSGVSYIQGLAYSKLFAILHLGGMSFEYFLARNNVSIQK